MADPFSAPIHTVGMGFTRNTLDRADFLRQNPAQLAALRIHPKARYLLFSDLKPLMDVSTPQPKALWLGFDDVQELDDVLLLGMDGDSPHFAASVPANTALPGRLLDTRTAAMQMAVDETGVLAQARAMLSWHQTHKYCAKCGSTTHTGKGGYMRQCLNPSCNTEHFPRTDPVCIMLVIDSDRCLLGRQKQFPPGMYSALAGFLEPGETLEDCVRLEVFEEAGVKVGDVRYVASQPWPFPSSLMIGCFGKALSTDITLDTNELEDARWFNLADARASFAGSGPFLCPPPIAIAHHLLKAWVNVMG